MTVELSPKIKRCDMTVDAAGRADGANKGAMPAGVCSGSAGCDLADIEAYSHEPDGTDRRLDTRDFDGPALTALSHDAREHGDPTDDGGAD